MPTYLGLPVSILMDVREATHVRSLDNPRIERILVKWGISKSGSFQPPSKGGFGVITISGRVIDMWQASAYYKVEGEDTQDVGKKEEIFPKPWEDS